MAANARTSAFPGLFGNLTHALIRQVHPPEELCLEKLEEGFLIWRATQAAARGQFETAAQDLSNAIPMASSKSDGGARRRLMDVARIAVVIGNEGLADTALVEAAKPNLATDPSERVVALAEVAALRRELLPIAVGRAEP